MSFPVAFSSTERCCAPLHPLSRTGNISSDPSPSGSGQLESSYEANLWFVPADGCKTSEYMGIGSRCNPILDSLYLAASQDPFGSPEKTKISHGASQADPAGMVLRGEAHHARGDFATAISIYKQALCDPSIKQILKAKSIYNLSICYKGLGQTDQSAKVFSSLTFVPPDHYPIRHPTEYLKIHSAPIELIRIASEHERSGDYQNAIKCLDIVSVSRAFRSDASLLLWLSKLDKSPRSKSLRATALSILPTQLYSRFSLSFPHDLYPRF